MNSEMGYDPSKVHKVTFKGNHHNIEAFGASHPSVQRTPLLFQAGTSSAGKAFAAKHAEAVFLGSSEPELIYKDIKELRDLTAANGRDPQHIKVFP